jgi:hypothetical protein
VNWRGVIGFWLALGPFARSLLGQQACKLDESEVSLEA